MAQEVMENEQDEQLKKLEALEYHAWQCFREVEHKEDAFRDRLAALKMTSELLLAQLRYKKETQPKEDTENAQYYIDQFDSLRERVEELAERRRAMGHETDAEKARNLR